jgi:hypothetical protein
MSNGYPDPSIGRNATAAMFAGFIALAFKVEGDSGGGGGRRAYYSSRAGNQTAGNSSDE